VTADHWRTNCVDSSCRFAVGGPMQTAGSAGPKRSRNADIHRGHARCRIAPRDAGSVGRQTAAARPRGADPLPDAAEGSRSPRATPRRHRHAPGEAGCSGNDQERIAGQQRLRSRPLVECRAGRPPCKPSSPKGSWSTKSPANPPAMRADLIRGVGRSLPQTTLATAAVRHAWGGPPVPRPRGNVSEAIRFEMAFEPRGPARALGRCLRGGTRRTRSRRRGHLQTSRGNGRESCSLFLDVSGARATRLSALKQRQRIGPA